MADINDGGCAFPLHGIDGVIDYGMSLRDYFAAAALDRVMPSTADYAKNFSAQQIAGAIAEAAYIIADAMLVARAPRPEGEL